MIRSIRSIVSGGLLLGMLFVGGCVESNIFMGNDMVPPGQDMGTYIDSTMTVRTSLLALDSLATSGSGTIYLGKYNDAIFGSTLCQGASTFFGNDISDTDVLFGSNPVADSMLLNLVFANIVGDYDYPLEISLHELVDSTLSPSLQYFSNRDMSGRYDPVSVVDFTVTAVDTVVSVHLPASFYNRLLLDSPADSDNFYADDSLFHDTFKGFYFKLNNPAPVDQEGRMALLSLAHTHMQLHYRSTGTDGEIDTTVMNYFFYAEDYYRGNNFTTIEHDYTTADVSRGGVDVAAIDNSELSLPRAYIQSFGGVGARVALDTLHIDAIRRSALADGYNGVALHSAKIHWQIEAPVLGTDLAPVDLNKAPTRVGLYGSFLEFSFLEEYDPIEELQNPMMESQLGGVLNRSLRTYTQDITHTMQALFTKPLDVSYTSDPSYMAVMEMFVAMGNMGTFGQVVLGGGSAVDSAPKVVIVYTLVK